MNEGTASPLKTPRLGRFLFPLAQPLLGLGSVMLLAAWLAPNHYLPWTSFHGEAAAFAALCFFCLGRALQPRPAPLGAWVLLPLALIALVAGQWATGQVLYGGDALLSAMYLAGTVLAAWLGTATQDQRDPDPLTSLAGLTVAAAGLSTLLGVLQWLGMEQALGIFAAERGPDLRVYANLGQPNHLGTLCVMGIALAAWLWVQGRVHRWQFVALLAWLSLGLTLSESRSGLVSALAVGALWLWNGRRIGGLRNTVLAWWAGLAGGYLLLPRVNEWLLIARTRDVQLQDDNSRFTMWGQALTAIREAPWLGHGWRQSMLAMKQAAPQVPGHLATDYAHNFALDLLIWVGVPLGLALLAVAAWWLLRAWLRLAGERELFLFAPLLPFLVHSFFEFPFAYAYFLFPVAWLAGALGASQAARRAPAAPRRRRDLRLVLFGGGLAFGALGLAIAMEYVQAEEDYRVMRFELRRVGRTPDGYEAPDLVLLTQLKELLEVGRIEARPGLPPDTIRRMGNASERNGWATLDLTYAAALGLNGQPGEATRRLAQLPAVYGKQSAQQAFDLFRAEQARYPALKQVQLP